MIYEIATPGGEKFRFNLAHVTCIARRPDDGSKEPNISIYLTGGAAPFRFVLTGNESQSLIETWEEAIQR